MRRREVLLLAFALVYASAPAFALPVPPPGPFLPHAAVNIVDNTGFTAANGVVAGTGTTADPFVISGWSFTGSGIGIRIHNVTAAFVIRNNSFDVTTGIQITASAGFGVIQNNQFIVRTTGVAIANADAHVLDNSFIGVASTGRGVDLVNSNSRVESNAFLFVQIGVRADRGSPSIVCNDFHDDVIVAGVHVQFTTNATIACNIMTQCTAAIIAVSAIGTIIANNTISSCFRGIDVRLNKDVNITNNSVRFSLYTQIKVDTTSGNITGNVVLDGRAEGILVWHSPMLVANNTVHNNLRVGIQVTGSGADLAGNVILRNNVGVALADGSVVHLRANVLANNTVGLDIPYGSRQTIAHMEANVVNGFNVDGTLNPSQKAFFYQEANVTVQGQVFDSGFSAGYFGSISAQGGVLLYEVDTANINASVISHHSVGVNVVNSFNVNVNASVLGSNLVGVRAIALSGNGTHVPNCAVSIKDTNITIPVDPVATIGIEVKGCVAIVGRVNVSIVDTGIKIDGAASITLFNSTINETALALDIQGVPGRVNLTGNVIVNNIAGARLSGTVGVLANNTFHDNDLYGVRLENAADVNLTGNNFSANGVGLVDAEFCGGPLTCSKVTSRGNAFVGNVGDGARVQGTSSWRNDVALGNGEDGLDLGSSATLKGVLAAGNERDGARLVGTFEVEDSTFTQNDEDGLDIRGSGALRDSIFTHNEQAGIRIAATFVSAIRLNVSHNFDGILTAEAAASPTGLPTLSTPGLLSFVGATSTGGPSPFDVHRSVFYQNERDAIRAGVAIVNATHNFWGVSTGPVVSVADTIGAFQNGVSPAVRFVPFYTDPSLTTVGPVAGL